MDETVDLDGLQGFLDESHDSMQNIESDFIELENDPNNMEIINRIFRPIHSLKGNSGFFGLMNINKFAHRLENLLDYVRNGELIVSKEIIDLLLTGIEYLQEMLEAAQENPEATKLSPEEEEFLQQVELQKPEVVSGSVQSVIDLQEILTDALDKGVELNEHSIIQNLLSDIEKVNAEIKNIVKSKSTNIQDIYSASGSYTFEGVDYTDKLIPVGQALEKVAANKVSDKRLIDDLANSLNQFSEIFADDTNKLESIDELKSMLTFLDDELLIGNDDFAYNIKNLLDSVVGFFTAHEEKPSDVKRVGEILVEQNTISSEQLTDALNKQKMVGEILIDEGMVEVKDLNAAIATQNKQILQKNNIKSAQKVSKTIRIDQAKLDAFANHIGELFINIDSLNYLKKQLELAEAELEIISKFTNTVTTFNTMVDQLHESVMEIRRVPVKTLFQRFPKVMRQLAAKVDKQVDFKIVGEDTVIDKDLLEKIENPLVHILRNSVDHGLEPSAAREAKGKNKKGTLVLKAFSDDNFVHIKIIDDGNGIDPNKIKKVAVEKEFLSDEEVEKLSDQELVNLIFKPGFSCAEQVSDISGRGVGMDVVMSGLNDCRGTINVDSKINEGTEVSIKIPLTKTLVAKEAMLVESGGHLFAVDSDDISTTIDSSKDQINLFHEEDCVEHEGSIYRLVNVSSFFFPQCNQYNRTENNRNSKNVIVISHKYDIALLVDKVISHQKVVVKDFTSSYLPLRKIKGVNGYTILGNEDIVLIMDMQTIAQ